MKIKDKYILKKIAGKNIVIPVEEEAVNFNGIITLNETSVFLFEKLKNETSLDELVSAMVNRYDVEEIVARKDINEFIQILSKKGLI